MRSTQIHRGQSLERTQQFLDAYADILAAANASTARRELDAAAAKFRSTVDEQGTRSRESRGEVQDREQLESRLVRKYMTPLAKFARASLKGVASYAALTPSAGDLRSARLVNSARAMLQAALPFADRLAAVQYPADFLEQFGKATEAVAESMSKHAATHRLHVGATKEMEATLRQGRSAVAVLDSIVSHLILGNVRLEAEWRDARRVTKSPGRRSQDEAPVTPDVSVVKAA